MKCLIIAAGKGSRLGSPLPKPLTRVLGVPLLERVILSASEAGAEQFLIVVGHAGDEVCAFLGGLRRRRGLEITVLPLNTDGRENGWSVLSARDHLDEPFLLLMADHLIPPAILKQLINRGLDGHDVVLGVDTRVGANGQVEDEDVTRVLVEGGLIRHIGKGIDQFNGYDTGAFVCVPTLFAALEQAAAGGDTSLSAGIRELAAQGRAAAFSVTSGSWLDVDTQADLRKAERLLLRALGKKTDGPVSRHLNRRFSLPITAWLCRTSVTPNVVSVTSFLLALIGSGLFLHPSYWALAAGGLLAQSSSILDGTDGELARLKWMATKFGGWFDAILDRCADAFLLAGLTYHAHLARPGWFSLVTGFLALTGSFVNTYSAGRFDEVLQGPHVLSRFGNFRIGRDVRLLLVFLGALLDLPLFALGLIAILMNAEVARRLLILRGVLCNERPTVLDGVE